MITKDLKSFIYSDVRWDGSIAYRPRTLRELLAEISDENIGVRRALSVVAESIRLLREETGETVDPDRIPIDDPATLALFREGRTGGVFRFRCRPLRKRLRRHPPERFEDLAAWDAFWRPSTIAGGFLDVFIRRLRSPRPARPLGLESLDADVPALDAILEPTRGVPVFHEQFTAMAREIAGFSSEEAYTLRRAASRVATDAGRLERLAPAFASGCAARGLEADTAARLFDWLRDYSMYAISQGNTVAVTWLAWQQAWLKTHHPARFRAACNPFSAL